jgi:hypothetical protein
MRVEYLFILLQTSLQIPTINKSCSPKKEQISLAPLYFPMDYLFFCRWGLSLASCARSRSLGKRTRINGAVFIKEDFTTYEIVSLFKFLTWVLTKICGP